MNLLAPRFVLRVEGQDLRPDLYRFVRGVTLEMSAGMADVLTLSLINPLSDKTGARLFTDSAAFLEGNRVQLWMGYGANLVYMGRYYVGKWYPNFPRDALPILQVKAYDFRMKMTHNTRHDGYTFRMTDSQVAEHVCHRHWALTPMIAATTRKMVRPHKRGGNDLQFMNYLAHINNYHFFTFHREGEEKDRFWWGPLDAADHPYRTLAGKRRYYWGDWKDGADRVQLDTLYTFEPNWAVHGQTSAVVVTFFDGKKQQEVSVDVRSINAPPNADYYKSKLYEPIRSTGKDSTLVTLTAFGESEDVHADAPVRTREEARIFAERWFLEKVNSFIIARGTVVGNPLLRPFQTHEFGNIGLRFGGDYYLTTVTHRMDGGMYECDMTGRKRALVRLSSRTMTSEAGHGGEG